MDILAVMFGSGMIIGPDPSQLKLPSCSVVKNLCASAGDTGDPGSIPGLGRFPGEGNGNPLKYSCLGNPMDRGAWCTIAHGSQRVRHD